MNDLTIQIGWWIESEAREFSHCPTSYAADHETLRVTPGRYPLRVSFSGGYTLPMTQWLLARLDTVRVSGATYNGFGGVNYSSNQLKAGEAKEYVVQTYAYTIPTLVATRRVELLPQFAALAYCEHRNWQWFADNRFDWKTLRAVANVQLRDSGLKHWVVTRDGAPDQYLAHRPDGGDRWTFVLQHAQRFASWYEAHAEASSPFNRGKVQEIAAVPPADADEPEHPMDDDPRCPRCGGYLMTPARCEDCGYLDEAIAL